MQKKRRSPKLLLATTTTAERETESLVLIMMLVSLRGYSWRRARATFRRAHECLACLGKRVPAFADDRERASSREGASSKSGAAAATVISGLAPHLPAGPPLFFSLCCLCWMEKTPCPPVLFLSRLSLSFTTNSPYDTG